MLTLFRYCAWAEGVSYLVLLLIAMPVKYVLGEPRLVEFTGMAHGVLFIGYVGLLIIVALQMEWSLRKTVWGFIASLLPAGTFYFERQLEK